MATDTLGAATQGLILKIEELVMDSSDPRKLARFWAHVLAYEIYEEEADLSERYDELIRQYLLNGPGAGVPPGSPSDAAKLPEAK